MRLRRRQKRLPSPVESIGALRKRFSAGRTLFRFIREVCAFRHARSLRPAGPGIRKLEIRNKPGNGNNGGISQPDFGRLFKTRRLAARFADSKRRRRGMFIEQGVQNRPSSIGAAGARRDAYVAPTELGCVGNGVAIDMPRQRRSEPCRPPPSFSTACCSAAVRREGARLNFPRFFPLTFLQIVSDFEVRGAVGVSLRIVLFAMD